MQDGIQTRASRYSVDETVARLQSLLEEKGVRLFCIVDHSGEARATGLEMPPTKVLIFGSPKAGTPLMLAAPSLALDLPLRILVAESSDRSVLVSWNDPEWLQRRHGFPADLMGNLAAAGVFAERASQ